MRNLLTILLTLAISSVWAQTFEGTIKWSMKMEITDPVLKAKMEEGQENERPGAAKKMKEMQEQMNDPKMKAMMDANPAISLRWKKCDEDAARRG